MYLRFDSVQIICLFFIDGMASDINMRRSNPTLSIIYCLCIWMKFHTIVAAFMINYIFLLCHCLGSM